MLVNDYVCIRKLLKNLKACDLKIFITKKNPLEAGFLKISHGQCPDG
jgi:hypothetical protein